MIIGLTGQLQSGKDTVADHLVEYYGFEKVGFSDALYDAVCTLFGITREQAERFKVEDVNCHWARSSDWPMISLTKPVSMRQILQRMGTDVGREMFAQNLWTVMLENKITKNPEKDYVIRDVRFDNEAKMIKFADTEEGELIRSSIWKILRPGFLGDSHPSEAGINQSYVNMEIHNDRDLDYLYKAIDEIMEVKFGRVRGR